MADSVKQSESQEPEARVLVSPAAQEPDGRRVRFLAFSLALFTLTIVAVTVGSIYLRLGSSASQGGSLRKCREGEFVPDEDQPANKGVQARVAILRDPVTNHKYFFKAHKSANVFRQERNILHRLGRERVTPRAICFVDGAERGIVMELAQGGDLYSESWYRPDNPLRFESYDQLVHATAHFVASLATVHSKGYLHNDLRPGNVIFNHPHRLQVIDFGLSRRIGKKGFHTRCSRNSPPETAFLHNAKDRYQKINSTASDWYTLGVLTHFFMAKGLFCINSDNFYWHEECGPGQFDMFWPYQAMHVNNKTKQVDYEWTQPPVAFPEPLKEFLGKLIVVDPLKRDFRGAKLNELLKLELFSSINWTEINSNLIKS